MTITQAAVSARSVLALDLQDLLEDWAVCRGFGLDGADFDASIQVGLVAIREGADLGDAFERAKNHLIRA